MAEVYLDEESHIYYDKSSGEQFKSVTTILSLLEQEFKSDVISKAISVRDKRPQQDILDEWKKINKDSIIHGNKIHNIIEEYLKRKRMYFPTDEFEKQIIRSFNKLNIFKGYEIYPEKILYSEEDKLCGTVDIIEVVREKGYFNIFDLKTNKSKGIVYSSDYGDWLKEPISHLSQCNYHIYSLQLSIYAYMFQLHNDLKLNRLALLYYNEKDKTFTEIPVPYMKKEVEIILDWWKTQQS